jgi:hypothetical protein
MSTSRPTRLGGPWFFWLRFGAVGLVFVLSLAAYASGVGTADLVGTSAPSLAARLYYTAGLFVFGGLDLGIPTGGPPLGRTALWIAFFLAPAVTTSAVAEAFLRIMRPTWLTRASLRGHVVIVGAGQVGRIYREVVRSLEPKRQILLVDRDVGGRTAIGNGRGAGVQFLQGDARSAQTLQEMELRRASALVSVTDSDLVNLESAWSAKARQPTLNVAAHVSDLTLLRPVARNVEGTHAPEGFNTHQMGALHLYQRHLQEHFRSTGYRDVVVLAAFGRFGQTILEILLREAPDELGKLVIVDRQASMLVRQFEADVAPLPAGSVVCDGDMTDPATWNTIVEEIRDDPGDPIILVGSGNEVENIRAALQLRNADQKARIFARCFHRSAFSVALARQSSFELLSFEDVLRQSLQEHYRALVGLDA